MNKNKPPSPEKKNITVNIAKKPPTKHK